MEATNAGWRCGCTVAGNFLVSFQTHAAKSFKDFPGLSGVERRTLKNAEGDRLDILGYMSPQRQPALVMIPGSLCAPVFVSLDKGKPGEGFATAPLLSEGNGRTLGAHVIYLERRNMVSLETLSSAPEFTIDRISSMSPCTDRNGGATLEQRVRDALVQVRWLKAQKWVSSVHLIGVSEGGDVAAGVAAAAASEVDSIMLVGSAGPSQFFDFVVFARQKRDRKGVQAAFSALKQFLSLSPPASYKGYSAKHWQSFAVANSSLQLLYKSNIPVFIAHGELDQSVPIASADLAAVELMVHQPRRALYYWSVARGDHALATPTGSRMWDAISAYAAWATSRPSGQKFRGD